jgi:hypothetical protein
MNWIGGVAGLAIALAVCGASTAGAQPARAGQMAPEVAGAPWVNSGPLTMTSLKGRVVLVEFWTYG